MTMNLRIFLALFALGTVRASTMAPRRAALHAIVPPELLHRIAHGPAAPALDIGHHHAPQPRAFRVDPAAHGGDPTGVKDSWAALTASVAICLNQSAVSPNGHFPGDTSFGNGKFVADMGGCAIDLGGGEYRISRPVVIPEYNANMQLGHGSIVADPAFAPPDGTPPFLIVIGVDGSCQVPQGSCNIDLNFPELFLDGRHVAGGMQINNVMGVTIGPGAYFLNFTGFGLQINDGHEVMVDRCWFGSHNFDFDYEANHVAPNATAIQINGNDHYILNSIVFASKVGVEVNGAANRVSGVHVWFPINRALAFPDTMAFHIAGGGNRFTGCYIDGGRAVFEPGATGGGHQGTIWTDGYECCAGSGLEGVPHGLILKTGAGAAAAVGPGLHISHCNFNGGSIWHQPASWPSGAGGANAPGGNNCSAAAGGGAAGAFPVNVSGVQCHGLTHAGHAAAQASAAACEAFCCGVPTCAVWQWDTLGGGGSAAGCWTGVPDGPCGTADPGTAWVGGARAHPPAPAPLAIAGALIAGNYFRGGGGGRGTRATQALTQHGATRWAFDFCDALVFGQIAIVRSVTVQAATGGGNGGFPQAVARPAVNCTVVIETSEPVTGTVVVEVDSSLPSTSFV